MYGHAAHDSMLLGAAKILKQHEKEIQGIIVLVFQREEGRRGIKNGRLVERDKRTCIKKNPHITFTEPIKKSNLQHQNR